MDEPTRTARLHSAARRYCIAQHRFWTDTYRVLCRDSRDRVGASYTTEAYSVFPRYNVLNAILVDIERLTTSDLGNSTQGRELLELAAQTASTAFTRPPTNPIEEQAMTEERLAFCRFLQNLTDTDLEQIEPLFHRRVLRHEEVNQVFTDIERRWRIRRTPSAAEPMESDESLMLFQEKRLLLEVNAESVRAYLSGRGIHRVWELREFGPSYEVDLEGTDFIYNGADGYWASPGLDWVWLASHESFIAVGGWLLHLILRQHPTVTSFPWTSESASGP